MLSFLGVWYGVSGAKRLFLLHPRRILLLDQFGLDDVESFRAFLLYFPL